MRKNNQYKFNNSHTKKYLIGVSGFLLLFIGIMFSPYIFGKSYSYAEAKMNEYQTINNTMRMSLVKKEYNPEEKLVRLDFLVDETAEVTSLPNIKYEVESKYVSGNKKTKSEIKKINNNYFIVFIKDVPKDFEVLSSMIIPSYINPELQSTNDLENKSLKIYVNQTDKIENLKLKIQPDTYYKKEFLMFKQKDINNQISEKETIIEHKEMSIKEIKNLIKDLENELQYQTEDEKFETYNTIQSHKTTIKKYENDIEEENIFIKELNERIKMLEQRKIKG